MPRRDSRLSRRESERLLDDPAATNSALGTALTAATAPASPAELRGEEAAVSTFHAARVTPPGRRDHFVSPSRLGRHAAARAVLVTAAVVVAGTTAFAVSSGLPALTSDPAGTSVTTSATSGDPWGPPASTDEPETGTTPGEGDDGNDDGNDSNNDSNNDGSGQQSPGSSSAPPSSGTATPRSEEPDPQTAPSPPTSPTSPTGPGPDLADQCRSFLVGQAAPSPALVDAAGGPGKVARFCASLLGDRDKGDKGDKGEQGQQGEQGQSGEKGQKGQKGEKGDKPDKPDKPGKPGKPGKPDKPDKPGKDSDDHGDHDHGDDHGEDQQPMTSG